MKKEIENRTTIDLKEKRRAMMHTLLDGILDSNDAGAIHAVHLNLKVYLEKAVDHIANLQKRAELERRLWRLENELKPMEQSDE